MTTSKNCDAMDDTDNENEQRGEQQHEDELLDGSQSSESSPKRTFSNQQQSQQVKCKSCGKVARKDCTQSMCIKCCNDTKCDVHEQQRQKALWKEQVLLGTTDIQLQAAERRRKKLPKGRFKEPAFQYLGDTVIIWDIRQCLFPHQYSSSLTGASGLTTANSSTAVTSSSASQTDKSFDKSSSTRKITNAVVEDILNRARKRNRLSTHSEQKVLRNNKKRFRRVIEQLYRQSLHQ